MKKVILVLWMLTLISCGRPLQPSPVREALKKVKETFYVPKSSLVGNMQVTLN